MNDRQVDQANQRQQRSCPGSRPPVLNGINQCDESQKQEQQYQRKLRLTLVILLVAGVSGAIVLVLTALNKNINLFFSPAQVDAGEVPAGSVFRLGGMVVVDSVKRNDTDLTVMFALTDTASTVQVAYTGLLPDLFREGQGIVALGTMQDDVFVAREVLAKHDATYMPPEISDALDAARKAQVGGGQ